MHGGKGVGEGCRQNAVDVNEKSLVKCFSIKKLFMLCSAKNSFKIWNFSIG